MSVTILNYINGELVPAQSGATLPDLDPATAAPLATLPGGDARDVDAAVAAAERAFPAWSATPAADRSRMLLAIADAIERDLDRFAKAESTDTGKPLSLARSVDIPRAVANFRFFATAILHFASESHVTDLPGGHALNYTLRDPRGVCGLIAPWNLPLYLLSWKIAPALATGNTAVAKPSELTPLTAHLLAESCRDVGLPPGVLNIVHGLGPKVGQAIAEHPRIRTISFTGGTATGARISAAAALHFKKLSLELGGKNPNVIFADADLDAALEASLRSSFTNQGQVCLCGSRIFVERPIYTAFVERFVAAARSLRVGDPLDPATGQGALISAAHRDKVRGYVDIARAEGATIACGGGPPADLPPRCRDGYFFSPTVLLDLPEKSRCLREEIFGPVVTVSPFESESQLVELANSVDYGLSASIWTRDLARAHRIARRIAAGTVWVNCWMLRDLRVPFGGTKHSGVGREGGWEALHFFTEPKNVCVRI